MKILRSCGCLPVVLVDESTSEVKMRRSGKNLSPVIAISDKSQSMYCHLFSTRAKMILSGSFLYDMEFVFATILR